MVLNGAHLVGDVTPIPVFPVGIILIHRQPQGDAWEGPTDVGVQREIKVSSQTTPWPSPQGWGTYTWPTSGSDTPTPLGENQPQA